MILSISKSTCAVEETGSHGDAGTHLADEELMQVGEQVQSGVKLHATTAKELFHVPSQPQKSTFESIPLNISAMKRQRAMGGVA